MLTQLLVQQLAFASGFGTANTQTYTAVTAAAATPDLVTAGDSQLLVLLTVTSLDADTSITVGYQNAKDADSHLTQDLTHLSLDL